MIALFIFYRRRKRRKEQEFQTRAAENNRFSDRQSRNSRLNVSTSYGRNRDHQYGTPKSDDNVVGVISPSDSLLSAQSLLSAGNSMGGDSVNEQDGTHHLADEFDQYKDQNLEKMRSEVNESLSGADAMMSQAMFLAFMDNEETTTDPNELYWGGSGDPTEIEASALCEMNDWLKRKEGASLEERYVCMLVFVLPLSI